jgi:carboxymethylenebutenolidase
MGEKVTFPSNGNTAHGYLAVPASGSGPGLIVIQEWWGLVDHIEHVTDRFAAAGFVALAPDLYGGKTTHDADTAGKYLSELPVAGAVQDLSGAVDYLLGRSETTSPTVGAVGFCMGGAFVLMLAEAQGAKVSAAAAAYPVNFGDLQELSNVQAQVAIHVGDQDQMVDKELVDGIVDRLENSAGVRAEVWWYEGQGHAFMNDENLMGTYDKAAADLLWNRLVDFLHANIT